MRKYYIEATGGEELLARSKPINNFAFILSHTQKSGSPGLYGKNINVLNQGWLFASVSSYHREFVIYSQSGRRHDFPDFYRFFLDK